MPHTIIVGANQRVGADRILRQLLPWACLLLLIALSGCARLTSIYRHKTLETNTPQLTSIDAKQRVILSAPDKPGDAAAQVYLRFCAEPPPDVFTALAASLGVEANVARTTDPSAAAKLAGSISENASTIERTQTINILRESMYRNCERYLSGAIEASEFIVQAARDQQLIIQVLAIEQITGAVKAQATALTTVANSAASGPSDTSLNALMNAKADYNTKQAASDQAALSAKALPPVGACADPIDETAPPTGVSSSQAMAKNAACASQHSADAEAAAAKDYYTTIQNAVNQQSAVSADAQGTLTSAATTVAASSEAVAKQVVEIVKLNQNFDEIGMTCVVWLRKMIDENKDVATLPNYCKSLLELMSQTRQNELVIGQLRTLEVQTAQDGDLVWNALLAAANPEAALTALENKAGQVPATRHQQLLAAVASRDKNDFMAKFKKLPLGLQQALAAATKP